MLNYEESKTFNHFTHLITVVILYNLYYYYLYLMYWKWKWSCSAVSDSLQPMDGSLPGCEIHRIFQARILEWAAISFSRGSSQTRDRTWVSCIADRRFTVLNCIAWGHIYSLESASGGRGSRWQQEEHFAPGHWVEIRELWNIDTPTHHPQGGRPDPFREQSMRVGAARCHLLAHSLLLLGSSPPAIFTASIKCH